MVKKYTALNKEKEKNNMSSCSVTIDEKEYDGEYTIDDGKIQVEIYNYSSGTNIENGEFVKYKEIEIYDLRNKTYIYSPTFYHISETWSLAQYETFKTDFYFQTSRQESFGGFEEKTKIKTITFYHPMFIHYFKNPCLFVKKDDKQLTCTLNLKSDNNEISIRNNNIDKIVFGGVYSYSIKNENKEINIEADNYAEIVLDSPIEYEAVLEYINEFDVFVNAYYPIGQRSYKTFVKTVEDKNYILQHKLLGKEEQYTKAKHKFTKLNFFDFIQKMYQSISYRETQDRNKYVLLDFKKPTSLEDQYTYYFRYIDLFMGEYIKAKTGNEPSNYDRISTFVDEYTSCFDARDTGDLEKLKQELNSLRNHYVHEGYYLPEGEFKVTGRKRELLYVKAMDFKWLYRITQALKQGSYQILYTKILDVDINKNALKLIALK